MRLSELLVAKKLVTTSDIERAYERQRRDGGQITDSLLALDLISITDLHAVLAEAPPAPSTIFETGLKTDFLLKLLMKVVYVNGAETVGECRDVLKLPASVVVRLLKEAVARKLLEEYGASAGGSEEIRVRMTSAGKAFTDEAMDQSQYVGPVPVPLATYTEQVMRQAITKETVTPDRVVKGFSDLIIADEFLNRLGPALNSGKSMLLYGPPGNGKTTIAEKIGHIFENVIFIPYCVEVGGEIIAVFDPSIHEPAGDGDMAGNGLDVRREDIDRRWVACHRPFVITGGELTLEMLDLRFNEISKFYEAPLHWKAQGGTFVIDDFGRQIVRPEDLLNRWIIPLERRIDFLKLHTGKQFELPFDQLVIFSTNMTPDDLMDAAFLRRIPYKIEVGGPSRAEFRDIFGRVCAARDLPCSDEDVDTVLHTLLSVDGTQLACYQAKFIVDQVLTACRYQARQPRMSPDLIADAVANIYAKESPNP